MTKPKPRPVENEEEVSEQEVRTFTSWKLDLLETVNADPLTTPADLAIIEAYLHFTRARSRTAYLSALALRVRTAIGSSETIVARRKHLIRLGYLVDNGQTRAGVRVYRIVNAREAVVSEHVRFAQETLQEADARRKQKDRERQRVANLGPTKIRTDTQPVSHQKSNSDGMPVSPEIERTSHQISKTNTCREQPVVSLGIEGGDRSQAPSENAYLRASRGY